MTGRKKRRPALPRLTMLAVSKRELSEFMEAFLALKYQVEELRELVQELRVKLARSRKPRESSSQPANRLEDM